MNKMELSNEEIQLITIIRDLKPFEVIDIKREDKTDQIVFTYTNKKRFILLTHGND